ncbi:hypothetical protein PVK06_046277 [Gossypium arboreum]|uniref:Uncharacterized protein n=1 Tax=Gossypium arboreum TaxID=29729 RepID=A0ABR0MA09_GOSAR|nr:hypothetical protein PVK06_046277 [Gossypium arboreum]
MRGSDSGWPSPKRLRFEPGKATQNAAGFPGVRRTGVVGQWQALRKRDFSGAEETDGGVRRATRGEGGVRGSGGQGVGLACGGSKVRVLKEAC